MLLKGIYGIDFVLLTISKMFEGPNSSLPSVIQNLGLALLSILIPLAIAILTDLYQKKGSEKASLTQLDLQVILDRVFRIKRLLVYGILTFLPFIFWENSNVLFRMIEIALSFIGNGLIAKTIIDVYNWTRGNVFTFRFSYLKKLKNPDDMEAAWRSVWLSKDVDVKNEKDFFNIFTSKIDEILAKSEKRHRYLITILNDFSNSLDNRSTFFVINKEVFQVLEWNLIVWKLMWQNWQKKSDDRTDWFETSRILDSIIRKIASLTLKEQYFFSTIFLKNFQKHLEAHKRESIPIEEKTRFYVEDMLRIFYQILFEFEDVANYSEKDYMWSQFPNKWKITKENLIDKENLFSRISRHEFLQWTMQRLTVKRDTDLQLNDLSINLFPEVEPATWARILIFVLSPYNPENRVNSIIAVRRSFGYDMKAAFVSFSEGDLKKQLESEMLQKEADRARALQNTYEFAAFLFPNIFTKENLKSFIQEATDLKYPENSMEEHNRQEFLEIFYGLQKVL
jgi:hypothetical protein